MDGLTDATLRRIDQVVNQDVEMQHSTVEEVFNLIVDTNILLHQLDALQQFVVDIEHHLPFTLQIIVPGIVISELDRRHEMIKWRGQRVWPRRGCSRK
jgi:rRNA-processing protein FCF1